LLLHGRLGFACPKPWQWPQADASLQNPRGKNKHGLQTPAQCSAHHIGGLNKSEIATILVFGDTTNSAK
jgi:hypothetical protein